MNNLNLQSEHVNFCASYPIRDKKIQKCMNYLPIFVPPAVSVSPPALDGPLLFNGTGSCSVTIKLVALVIKITIATAMNTEAQIYMIANKEI